MLKKLFSNAMLSIVMDKQAKEKLRSMRETRNGRTTDTGSASETEKPDKQAKLDRKQLISQAMAVHQEQTKILDDLTLNEKAQLQELAAKTLMGVTAKK